MPRYRPNDASMTSYLDKLARQHGISLVRPSPNKGDVAVTDDTKRRVLAALGVAVENGPERHSACTETITSKEICPQCYLPEFLETHRVWGINLQLYELRSGRNWGIGDFGDLIEMIGLAASLGANFVGLNPLHAPFLADPNRCSPYEPSNRQMLNPLYIAVDRVEGFKMRPEIEEQLGELRSSDLVDYSKVATTKISALRDIWERRQSLPSAPHEDDEFKFFVQDGGEMLRRHAIFEALSQSMSERGQGAGWKSWPVEYRRPETLEIGEFVDGHLDTIDFHMWLQWLAHSQLTEATEAARDAKLQIGLYLDVAVGEAVDGSATWSQEGAYVADATIGSPPDPYAPAGQDWRLAAFHPAAIATGEGQAPFLRTLSIAMRYAGAIRIDHAAALRRLFLVPVDCTPEEGAYVDYPLDELLRILAETSSRFKCLVIGEDLGVLPDGLQQDLSDARILSYRILSYERADDGFKPASDYPQLSLACISTHDHQTLAEWWRGADIKARSDHHIVPSDLTRVHLKERQREQKDLIDALEQAQVDPPSGLPDTDARDDWLNDLTVSAHRFIAQTPSFLAAVRLADMTGETRPTNIPGTSDTYPNWKPKLSVPIERFASLPLLTQIAAAMREERTR